MRLFAVLCILLASYPLTSGAGERSKLGYGRLITNDLIGDRKDRWRTGSVASSWVWGPEWQGQAPDRFGQLIEFRFNAEVIAPESLTFSAPGDRPFVGALSFGLHTHYQTRAVEVAVGGDLVIVGPQTRLDDVQAGLHDFFDGPKQASSVRSTQIGNDVHPTGVIELGRTLYLSDSVSLRPFVEARAGVETLARVGADLSFGGVGQGALLIRDPVTGHRYRAIQNDVPGFSLTVGGDVAYVDHSEYLPSDRGLVVENARSRLRGGVHWQGHSGHRAFYGLTWLGREFEAQRKSGQIVGSVRLQINF
ncbi:DUF2219 family protein [Rhodobacteraceae bacterium KMM 6894]|nr:DUF2219 family protein [Rhodobacteraceae bacterium KMM 6894]